MTAHLLKVATLTCFGLTGFSLTSSPVLSGQVAAATVTGVVRQRSVMERVHELCLVDVLALWDQLGGLLRAAHGASCWFITRVGTA